MRTVNVLTGLLFLILPNFSTHAAPKPTIPSMSASALAKHAATIDVLHYDLAVQLNPYEQRMSVHCRINIATYSEQATNVYLRLNSSLRVRSVHDNDGNELGFSFSSQLEAPFANSQTPEEDRNEYGHVLVIHLPQSIPPNDEIILSIRYDGTVHWRQDGWIGYWASWCRNQAYWYPRSCGERVPWDDDWATSTTKLTVPSTWKAVSMGRLEGISSEDSNRTEPHSYITYSFVSKEPGVAYFAAGPFEEKSIDWGKRKLVWMGPSSEAHEANKLLADLKEFASYYEEQFGEYPFPKLAIVRLPGPWISTLGSSNPGCIFTAQGSHLNRDFLAHEVAHQWWGLEVRTLLLEGLATFSYVLHESQEPRPKNRPPFAFLEHVNSYLRASRWEGDNSVDNLLGTFETRRIKPVLYNKVSCIFWMLREQMGPGLFSQVLRAACEQYKWKSMSTQDWVNLCAEATGEDWTWFFNQWFGQIGVPRIQLSTVQANPYNDWWEISGVIQQSAKELFTIPVELLIQYKGGTHKESVLLDKPRKWFHVKVPKKPQRLIVDPDEHLLRWKDTPPTFNTLTNLILAKKPILIIYGTRKDTFFNLKRADDLRFSAKQIGITMQVARDMDMTNADLDGHQIVLIGGPKANDVSDRLQHLFPIRFRTDCFQWKNAEYCKLQHVAFQVIEHPAESGRLMAMMASVARDIPLRSASTGASSFAIQNGSEVLVEGLWHQLNDPLIWHFNP